MRTSERSPGVIAARRRSAARCLRIILSAGVLILAATPPAGLAAEETSAGPPVATGDAWATVEPLVAYAPLPAAGLWSGGPELATGDVWPSQDLAEGPVRDASAESSRK